MTGCSCKTYIQCTDHHSGIPVDNSTLVRCDSILCKRHFDHKIDRRTSLLVDRHICIRFEDHQHNQVHSYIQIRHSLHDILHFHHTDFERKHQQFVENIQSLDFHNVRVDKSIAHDD